MVGPLLQRSLPFLRRLPLRLSLLTRRRTYCSAAVTENPPPPGSATTLKGPPAQTPPIFDNLDCIIWEDTKAEIRKELEPIILLFKDILHSHRYLDGQRLTIEDEKAVIDKILAHHPNLEDKIGCGLDSIMVDRHPQFKQRCLFVVRTNGEVEDFSCRKCLKAYIRNKYPSHAERFLQEH